MDERFKEGERVMARYTKIGLTGSVVIFAVTWIAAPGLNDVALGLMLYTAACVGICGVFLGGMAAVNGMTAEEE